MHASHDLALAGLSEACAASLELEVVFGGADEGLAALARGECDLAGFHVANALPQRGRRGRRPGPLARPAQAHADPLRRARAGPEFARPGARIRGVHDLARPGVRFIHRQSRRGAGTEPLRGRGGRRGTRRRRLRPARGRHALPARLHAARRRALLLRLRQGGPARRGAEGTARRAQEPGVREARSEAPRIRRRPTLAAARRSTRRSPGWSGLDILRGARA
jgi:hypothetical protein